MHVFRSTCMQSIDLWDLLFERPWTSMFNSGGQAALISQSTAILFASFSFRLWMVGRAANGVQPSRRRMTLIALAAAIPNLLLFVSISLYVICIEQTLIEKTQIHPFMPALTHIRVHHSRIPIYHNELSRADTLRCRIELRRLPRWIRLQQVRVRKRYAKHDTPSSRNRPANCQ